MNNALLKMTLVICVGIYLVLSGKAHAEGVDRIIPCKPHSWGDLRGYNCMGNTPPQIVVYFDGGDRRLVPSPILLACLYANKVCVLTDSEEAPILGEFMYGPNEYLKQNFVKGAWAIPYGTERFQAIIPVTHALIQAPTGEFYAYERGMYATEAEFLEDLIALGLL